MKVPKQRLVPIVIVAVLLGGGYWVDRARAAQRSVLSGTFESQPSRLAPKIAGRVAKILVREGDSVAKGSPLVVLEARDAAFGALAAQAQARQAMQKEAEVTAGSRVEEIRRQSAVVAELTASLAKLVNGSRPEEIRSAEAQYEQARQRYLELVRGSRPEEIAQARAAVSEAQANLQRVRRGPNPQEKAQLRAQLDAAESDLSLAKGDLERKRHLAEEGAIAVQQVREYRDKYDNAVARRTQAAEALKRADLGGPPEETAQATASLRQARAKLDLALAGARSEDVAAAKAAVDAARENLRLARIGPRDEDKAAARARLIQAKAALDELVAGNRKEQVLQAEEAARAAKAQSGGAGVQLAERIVYAPKDGIVERVLVADGDMVSVGAPVVQFSDPTDIWLRVYVPEAELRQIRTGDSAKLSVDGLSGLVDGLIESISTQGEFTPANLQTPEERGKQVFAVRIRLRNPDRRIKAGMAATVKEIGSWRP